MNVNNIVSDIEKSNSIMREVLGESFSTRVIRFPGGYWSWEGRTAMKEAMEQNGYYNVDWNALIKELNRQSILFYIEGQWLYLYGIYQKGMLRLPVKYLKQRKKYSFRNNELLVDYVGNRIVGMSSEGKRLCFFKEVNK